MASPFVPLLIALVGAGLASHQEPLETPTGALALELSGAPEEVALRPAVAGVLYLRAASDTLDARLELLDEAGVLCGADDDSGGGRTAFLSLAVEAGELLHARVAVAGEARGRATLAWGTSWETDATRTAASAADGALATVAALARDGRRDAAVGELARAARALLAAEGAAQSDQVHARLDRLAGLAMELGALEAAALALESLVSYQAERLPASHRDSIRTLNRVAWLHSETGDEAAARDVLERLLATLEATRAADHPNLVTACTNLAVVRYYLGDIAGARALAQRSVDTLARGGSPRQLAVARGVLMGTLVRDGELERALELGETMLAATRRLDLPERLEQSAAQAFALVLQELGEYDRAEETLREVLAGYERAPPRSPRYALEAREMLAALAWARGEREPSLARLQAVREEALAVAGPLDPWCLHLAARRVRWLAELGRDDELATAAGELSAALLEHARELATRLAPRELDESLAAPILAGALDAVLAHDPSNARAFRVSESLRALGLRSAHRLRAARADPDLAAALDRLRAAQAAVRAAYPSHEQVEIAVRARDAAQRELLAAYPLGALEVDAAALPRAAARAFVTYRRHGVSERARYLAFVVDAGPPRRVDLGPASELERMVAAWRGAVVAGADPAAARAHGHALFDRLLGSLGLALEDEELRELVVVPDAALHLVAFDALPLGASSAGVAGDRVSIARRTSLRETAAAIARPPHLVAFGAVDYGGVAGSGPFPALEASATELEHVVGAFRARHGDDAPTEVVTGPLATPTALFASAPRASVLHLATHGAFDSGAEPAGVELLRATGLGAARLSPLSLAGLALAGANRERDALGRAPGRVSAADVAGLDLAGCELVVLSACDTGLGRLQAGAGVASLQRALHLAGARTVLASLWRVGDRAAADLVRAFYAALWGDGLAPREALWQAKRALRAERRPARDWAGWVLTGGDD